MSAAKRLAEAAEALANNASPEPVVTRSILTRRETAETTPQDAPAPPLEVAEAPPIVTHVPSDTPSITRSAPIFIIGPTGKLIQATPEQIFRAKKASEVQVAAASPDIEPRKSFFMPKPRIKPRLNPRIKSEFRPTEESQEDTRSQFANVGTPKAKQVSLPTSRIPKTSTPRIEVPAFAKPSIPRISDGTAPQSVHIRPTRRISPQLLNKLRRRLRTINKSKQNVSEINIEGDPSVTDAPTVEKPFLPKAVDVAPLPPAKLRTDQKVSKAPSKANQVAEVKGKNAPPETTGTVQKLLNGLGKFFGIKSEQKPEAIAEAKIEQTPSSTKPVKIEIARTAAPASKNAGPSTTSSRA